MQVDPLAQGIRCNQDVIIVLLSCRGNPCIKIANDFLALFCACVGPRV